LYFVKNYFIRGIFVKNYFIRGMNKKTILLYFIVGSMIKNGNVIDLPSSVKMDKKTYQRMMFIMNVLEKGWSVKKMNDSYIFTKKHEGKREVFMEDYLEKFIESNMNFDDFM
jgi:hypothetical protein